MVVIAAILVIVALVEMRAILVIIMIIEEVIITIIQLSVNYSCPQIF